MFKVGKLYVCEEYFLMLYPDPESAAAARTFGHTYAAAASDAACADCWSKRLGKAVSYADKNIPLLVLNSKEKYVEVLAGDRKGWIIFDDYLNIKEIDYA